MPSALPVQSSCCGTATGPTSQDCPTVSHALGLYPGNPNDLGVVPSDVTVPWDVWQTNADGTILLVRWTWNPNTLTWQ